jgi:hypothetical protein
MDERDTDKLAGQSFAPGEHLQVYVLEAKSGQPRWKENPKKIGAVASEHTYANLVLSSDAFASFWEAAEATDGARRSIEIQLVADGSTVLCATNVGFFEQMPAAPTTNPGKGDLPTPRLHPVGRRNPRYARTTERSQ